MLVVQNHVRFASKVSHIPVGLSSDDRQGFLTIFRKNNLHFSYIQRTLYSQFENKYKNRNKYIFEIDSNVGKIHGIFFR